MRKPIEDYALIGDCRTSALISRDGSLDWLCWPRFDSDACFAALLGDERNGFWQIAPKGKVIGASRRYRPNTLIHETRFETAEGVAVLVDFMPPGSDFSSVVRLVRCERGSVEFHMDLVLRFGMGQRVPWVRKGDDGALLAVCGPALTVLRNPVPVRGENLTTVADFELKGGQTLPFVLTYSPSHRGPPAPFDVDASLKDTERFWTDWSAISTYDGPDTEIVTRSMHVLKALTFAPTGGMVAAATTSLPELLGGSRNWDYRYCWLRDATFTLLAFINDGHTDEAAAWHNWLLRSVAGSAADMQIMYGITGEPRLIEWEASWLPGYEASRPVRIGNAAHAQLQLDVFGELMDVFHQSRLSGLKLDDGSWDLECLLLDHLSQIWSKPDSGIWERRGEPQHYVSSKVLAWVAFDRGIKSAEKFALEAPLDRWRAVREAIHRDVCEHGYDPTKNTFVECYGSDYLDASLLLIPAVGFLPVDDPRVLGTMKAIEQHLICDGFVLRHDPRAIAAGIMEPEAAFLACTLWLADAYVMLGDIEKARALFKRVVSVANDVGLFSEEYDTGAKRLVGNFPQALTHIAVVTTAHNLHTAAKPAVQRGKT